MKRVPPRALTPEQVTVLYGIPKGTLANLRYQRRGPRFYHPEGSRRVVYRVEDLEAWLYGNPILTVDQR